MKESPLTNLQVPNYLATYLDAQKSAENQQLVQSQLHQQQLVQQQEAAKIQQAQLLNQYSAAALNGDHQAFQQLAAIDPKRAQETADFATAGLQRVGVYSEAILSADEKDKAKVYKQVIKMAVDDPLVNKKSLAEFPDEYDSSVIPKLYATVQASRKLEDAIKAPQEQADLAYRIAQTGTEKAQQRNYAAMTQKNLAEAKNIGAPNIEQLFKNTTALRSDYLANSKTFQGVKEGYERVAASAIDPSPAGDLSLIFGYMKTLDPNSTVREGEFANAQNSGSAFNRVGALYNKVLNGERLTEEQRTDFVNRSEKLYDQAEKSQKKLINQYTGIAERNKLNPQDVIVDFSTTVTRSHPLKNQALEILRQRGKWK